MQELYRDSIINYLIIDLLKAGNSLNGNVLNSLKIKDSRLTHVGVAKLVLFHREMEDERHCFGLFLMYTEYLGN